VNKLIINSLLLNVGRITSALRNIFIKKNNTVITCVYQLHLKSSVWIIRNAFISDSGLVLTMVCCNI